jgi:hypothetical protein
MITPEFRKKIKKWFYHYKTLLNIPRYWHVRINVDEKIKAYAEVSYDYQEKKFDIKINPKLNQELDDLKDSILHELIHVLFTPATNRLDLMIHKLECNEKVNFKRTKKNMVMYEEYLVSHIAKVIIKQEDSK